MVTPQTALGIGLGSVLVLIGAYLVWLERRLVDLEETARDDRERDERG